MNIYMVVYMWMKNLQTRGKSSIYIKNHVLLVAIDNTLIMPNIHVSVQEAVS